MKNSTLQPDAFYPRFLATLASVVVLVALGAAGFAAVVNKVTFESQPVYAGFPPQKVLILHDGGSVYGQTTAALDYAKIAHDDAALAAGWQVASLEGYTAMVIAAEDISEIGAQEALAIIEYVTEGGGLAVLAPARHPALDDLFGISGQEAGAEQVVSSGIHFVGDLLPGLEGLRIEARDIGEFRARDAATLSSVELLAATGDGSRPLLWQRRFGQGRVIYWNNDLLAAKSFRGLAVQSVMAVHGGAVMSLVNVGLLHVDGFPAPPPSGGADFYYRQWFPDMVELAGKYGARYTWLADFGRAEPPWNLDEWAEATAEVEGHEVPFCTYLAQRAGRGGHELALQVYAQEDAQEDALEAAAQRWQEDSLGPLPATCALPAGGYDETSLAALRAALPSVRVVGSDAFGDFDEGGDREFGPEPWNEELFAAPRWTSGYAGDPYTRLLALSELNTFGVWTHHVRADDAFGGDSWDEMRAQLDELLNWNEEHHPWLRWLTTSDAYPELASYFETGVTYTFDKAYRVTIEFSDQPTYLLLRLNDGRRLDMNSLVNIQVISYYEGQGYYQYVLRATDKKAQMGLLIPATSQ